MKKIFVPSSVLFFGRFHEKIQNIPAKITLRNHTLLKKEIFYNDFLVEEEEQQQLSNS